MPVKHSRDSECVTTARFGKSSRLHTCHAGEADLRQILIQRIKKAPKEPRKPFREAAWNPQSFERPTLPPLLIALFSASSGGIARQDLRKEVASLVTIARR